MVLSKAELIGDLTNELRVIGHLASKIDPNALDYRPSAKQRSTLELLRYVTAMGPIHLRGVIADTWDMDTWRAAWNAGQAETQAMSLEQCKEALSSQAALFAELLGPVSDEALRAEVQMFGQKATRGAMLVRLVLSHYAAYRMQLFLYLKSSGREELNTMNLWVGIDHPM
jgi:hypothetical protein